MVAETDAAEDRPLPSDAAKGAAMHFARITRGLPSTPRSRLMLSGWQPKTRVPLCAKFGTRSLRVPAALPLARVLRSRFLRPVRRTPSAKAHISLEAEPQAKLNSTHRARDLAA